MKIGDKLRPTPEWQRIGKVRRDDGSTYTMDENTRALCLQPPKDATGGIKILLLDDMTERVSLVERWEVLDTETH